MRGAAPMSTPVENVVQRLHAKRSGDGWTAKCPVHDDRDPSLRIREGNDGRALIKCHAGCQTNDVLAAIGLKPRDLFVSGKNDSEPPKQTQSRKTNDQNPQQFDWQDCVAALKPKDLVRLGNERWWSRAFCQWLRDEKKIGLYKGHFAFPVEREGKIVAAKYKCGSGPNDWGVYPTEQGAACFVLGDPKRAKNIHLDESQWDVCSLADRTDWFRDADNHAFVATPGSGNAKLIKGLIPPGASALAWPQNDESGEKWLRDLARYADAPIAKAIVPAPHKDLGEWCKVGASPEAIYDAWWRNELVEVPKPPGLGTLLDEICAFVRQYISFTSEAQPAVIALWPNSLTLINSITGEGADPGSTKPGKLLAKNAPTSSQKSAPTLLKTLPLKPLISLASSSTFTGGSLPSFTQPLTAINHSNNNKPP